MVRDWWTGTKHGQRLVSGAVLYLLMCWFNPAEATPQSNFGLSGGRMRRDVYCRDQQEYWSGGTCCLNCPAGTFVTSPCTTAGQRGTCQECDDGTFMEHTNGLKQCFRCSQCRSDQEVVTACTHTHNTECRCRPGRFCDPDQACELCKKCSRCDQGEETVRNCTSTSNTECKKVQSTSATPAAGAAVVVVLSLVGVGVGVVVVIAAVCLWNYCKRAVSQHSSEEQKPVQAFQVLDEGGPLRLRCPSLVNTRQLVRTKSFEPTEEERIILCGSFNSSASDSQCSLTSLTSCSSPASPPAAAPPQPPWRDDETFPRLLAVNGEESLRSCFPYFEELDLDYHKRFFRHLGINDNVVKDKDDLLFEDRIHSLLNIWLEKAGREATLDNLLQVLCNLNQRRTAENIKEKAVLHGHYLYEGYDSEGNR